MNKFIVPATAAAALLTVAGCSSSGSSHPAAAPKPCNTTKSAPPVSAKVVFHATGPLKLKNGKAGTEILAGTLGGKAAASNAPPTIPLTASGPVASTGSITLNGPNNGVSTIHFKAGNLAVHHVQGKSQPKGSFTKATCTYVQPQSGKYTAVSGKSTGAFAGATGHGTFLVTFTEVAPRKK